MTDTDQDFSFHDAMRDTRRVKPFPDFASASGSPGHRGLRPGRPAVRGIVAVALGAALAAVPPAAAQALVLLDAANARIDGQVVRAMAVTANLPALAGSTRLEVDRFPVLIWRGPERSAFLSTVSLELERFDPLAVDALVRADHDPPWRLAALESAYYYRGRVRGQPGSVAYMRLRSGELNGYVAAAESFYIFAPDRQSSDPDAYTLYKSASPLISGGGRAVTGATVPTPGKRKGRLRARLAVEVRRDVYERFVSVSHTPLLDVLRYALDMTAAVSTLYVEQTSIEMDLGFLQVWATVEPELYTQGVCVGGDRLPRNCRADSDCAPYRQSCAELRAQSGGTRVLADLYRMQEYWNQCIPAGGAIPAAVNNFDCGGTVLSDTPRTLVLRLSFFIGNGPGSALAVRVPCSPLAYAGAGLTASFDPTLPFDMPAFSSVPHEIGHVLGAYHTSCYPRVDGGDPRLDPIHKCPGIGDPAFCYSGPKVVPAEGQTIMAACTTSYSNPFQFHPRIRSAIRLAAEQSNEACIETCEGPPDLDRDGIADACDDDRDGDGVFDNEDNCILASNAGQNDADGDGEGDTCDACPQIAYAGRVDSNGDGFPDRCATFTPTSTWPPSNTPLPSSTPTTTVTATHTAASTPTPMASSTATASPAPAACPGDCNADAQVSVDELVMLINIAMGKSPLASCQAGDVDRNGVITVDEIVRALGGAFGYCETGTPPAA